MESLAGSHGGFPLRFRFLFIMVARSAFNPFPPIAFMKLLDYLDPSHIALNLGGSDKEEVLSALVKVVADQGTIAKPGLLFDSLMEREELGSTGIGHGVAIPHCRSKELTQPVVVFGRTESDVNFESIDGKAARIFFLLVAPENGENEHLHLLAKIARLMRDAVIRERLLALQTPAEVLELLGLHDLE